MMKQWAGLAGGWAIVLSALLLAVTPVMAAPVPTANLARLAQTAEDWRCVVVNGSLALNVRQGPGVDYGLVSAFEAGSQLEADYAAITSADGYNWLPVRYPGSEGWAITVRLSPCATESSVTPEPSPTETSPTETTLSETNLSEPGVIEGVNRDGTLDRYEIAQVARSVVLIANVRGSRIRATGTGTITSPDGLIVTNAHVVADADIIAVGMLDNLNDPPEYRYLGEIVSIDDTIDVALIAIRYDTDRRPVDTGSLNLPYIPSTLNPSDVYRGDPIHIFGYPGIGDNYLVVTTGSIVSVENGDLNGRRVPVWYRTDAEIAPGNSGGLAVNGNGEFVGIPTFVQTEGETGGRLGGIRPAEVALLAVMDAQHNVPTTAPEPPAEPGALVEGVQLTVQDVWLAHNETRANQTGIALHLAFTISGWSKQDAMVSARIFHDDLSSTPLTNPNAPSRYLNPENEIITSVPIEPCCNKTVYDDLSLFIPYDVLGFTAAGSYPLKIEVAVAASDGSWRRILSWEFVTYERG